MWASKGQTLYVLNYYLSMESSSSFISRYSRRNSSCLSASRLLTFGHIFFPFFCQFSASPFPSTSHALSYELPRWGGYFERKGKRGRLQSPYTLKGTMFPGILSVWELRSSQYFLQGVGDRSHVRVGIFWHLTTLVLAQILLADSGRGSWYEPQLTQNFPTTASNCPLNRKINTVFVLGW